MGFNDTKLSKSHKIAKERVGKKIAHAEKRLAQYRRLVEAEGIESQRLKAIDEARTAHKERDSAYASRIDSDVALKKSMRSKKHWHRRNNLKQNEWHGIYKSMKSDYRSARLPRESRFTEEISNAEPLASAAETSQHKRPNPKTAPEPKRTKTRKGQPLMNLQIGKLYEKCMRMADGS